MPASASVLPSPPLRMELPDSLLPFCQAPQQFLLDLVLAQGAAARFRVGDEQFLVLGDPALSHGVMNGGLEDFEKGELYEIPRMTLRDGIITADGAAWSEQHALLAPLFARRRMRELEPLIADAVRRVVDQWAHAADEPVDVLDAARRLAFDVVANGLLGIADPDLCDGLFDALVAADGLESVRLTYLAKRFGAGARGGMGLARSAHGDAFERLAQLTAGVADAWLAQRMRPDAFVGAVMAHETFLAFTPERRRSFLADLVATMLAAGYVTTGESVFWTLYLLAKHPHAQECAREAVLAEATGAVPMEAPAFLAAAFNESQRLYPPVWFLGRVARRDLRLGDIDIAAGTRVVCSPYVLHRLPALWPDAAAFRPERFLPGAAAAIAPRALVPFGTGMRACLGRGLALMEMSALVGATLARFDVALASDGPLSLAAAYSMHPREPVRFRLKALT